MSITIKDDSVRTGWTKYPYLPEKVLNEEHIPCLVKRNKQTPCEILVWNCTYYCWDNAEGNDFECDAKVVGAWVKLSDLGDPFAEFVGPSNF